MSSADFGHLSLGDLCSLMSVVVFWVSGSRRTLMSLWVSMLLNGTVFDDPAPLACDCDEASFNPSFSHIM